jgi:hypothetical protein
MADEIKKGATAEAPVKKNRRGVTNETKAVSQLKFHEKDSAQNGLFIGHLEDVTVNWAVGKEGTSFAGLKMPYLTFHFASQHTNPAEQRHVYNTLFPVDSNIATIPGGTDEWRVNNCFAWIKHMLDVYYLKGRMMTEAEEDALTLPFCDYDDNGEYVSYYDKWDLAPIFEGINKDQSFGIGKPIELYDRLYLDDYYGIGNKGGHATWLPEVTVTPNEYKNGGKLGLTSVEDIAKLYDDAIGHTFQTKG